MRVPLHRLLLVLFGVAAISAFVPVGIGHGQDGIKRELLQQSRQVEAATPSVPAAPTTSIQAVAPQAYLPLQLSGPEVAVQFAASRDADENLVNPTTEFTFGLKRLQYDVFIAGARGEEYRWEWTINGARITSLDRSGTVSFNASVFGGEIFFSDGSNLDRGTYTLTVFLNNQLYRQATAVIR